MSSDDLENWEPEPDWKSMLNVSPYRVDKKAEELRANCEPPRSRRYDCPKCGIARNVEPTFAGDEWHYYGQCSHCGQTWVHAYALMRKCEECGKRVRVTSRNPQGRCNCEGVTRPF